MTPTTAADAPDTADTFPKLIRATAACYGDDVAVLLTGDGVADETLSFAELARRSAELARGLLARGAGKGTRIGMIAGNGPFFATVFAAVARMGGIIVPISTTIRVNELVRVLRQSDVSGLIVQRTFLGSDYAQRLIEALPELGTGDAPELRIKAVPYLRWIASTGEGLPPTVRDLGYLTEAAAAVDEALLREVESEVNPADQLVEIYTSGSMALPKGVKHNHGPFLFRTHYIHRMLGPERGQTLPVSMPMFWVGGLMMSLMPNLAAGATTLCTERTLRNSRFAMGSVLAEEDLRAMRAKVIWGLGMSETIGPYSYGDELRVPGYPLCAPMDHIADRYEVRVADADDAPVAEGAIGEIQVRGYAVTPGLHKIDRDVYFTPDGYYRTGDMGFFDGSRLLFTGRQGDIIKTSGSNVSPAEVELEMQQLDGVETAYVVGLPDYQRGQIVVAAMIASEGAVLDVGAIEATLRTRLSSYKVPRAYVEISRDEVPLLHSNKVARRELAALLEERLGRGA